MTKGERTNKGSRDGRRESNGHKETETIREHIQSVEAHMDCALNTIPLIRNCLVPT